MREFNPSNRLESLPQKLNLHEIETYTVRNNVILK